MENVAQFIQRLAKKAGIAENDQNLINILSNADLTKVTLPVELVTQVDNNLLSLSQALDNHPDIKKQYHAQALNAFDANMANLIDESGLSDEKIAELKAQKNTYKRFEAFNTAIKEAAANSAKSKSGEDKSALQKQVDDLLAASKAAKADFETQIATIQKQRGEDRVNYELQSILGSHKTVFDELPVQAKNAALKTIVSQALAERKASFKFDDAGQFILVGEDDSAVLGAGNSKYTPQSLIDEVFAQQKVLKVSDPGTKDGQQQSAGATKTVQAGAQPSGNSQQIALNNLESLKNFERAVGA